MTWKLCIRWIEHLFIKRSLMKLFSKQMCPHVHQLGSCSESLLFILFIEQTMRDDSRFQSWRYDKGLIITLALKDSTSGLGKYFLYIISFNLDHKPLRQVSVSILTNRGIGGLNNLLWCTHIIGDRAGFSPGSSDSNTFAFSCYYDMLAAASSTGACLVNGPRPS